MPSRPTASSRPGARPSWSAWRCSSPRARRRSSAIMTTQTFHGAAAVMPWIAVGVVLQGVYLLTSIGLNITKRTEFYPVATGLAAATSIGAGLALVPGYGVQGAAAANALSYAVLATAVGGLRASRLPGGLRVGADGAAGVGRTLRLRCRGPRSPGRVGRTCRRCWRESPWPASSTSACSSSTGFATTTERQRLLAVWTRARSRRAGRTPSGGGRGGSVRDDGTGGQRGVGHGRRDHRGAAGADDEDVRKTRRPS